MFKSHEFCTHPRYFGMRRYESKLISQGKLNAWVYDQYLKQLMLHSSRIFWNVKGHGYETKFISQGKSIKAKELCILILHVLVCVGMSRRYETKFISQGKSIKAKEFCILILHVLVCVGMSQKFLAKAI